MISLLVSNPLGKMLAAAEPLLIVSLSSIINAESSIIMLPVAALAFQLKLMPPINMVRLLISNEPLPVKLITALSPLING